MNDDAEAVQETRMYTILAVDDSVSMRRMLASTLGQAGYEVVEAVDGEDALDKAAVRHFDLVLTDQHMPKLDGIGLTRKLRALARHATTPVLILTTESGDRMKQGGRSAGATGWLVKPFDPAGLLEVVRKVLPARSRK